MKRILIIAASLNIGGAEKVARDIGLYSSPEKHEFHYVVFHTDVGAYEQQIIDRGGRVFHMEIPSKDYFRYIRELSALIREYRYHAVHAHTMFNCGLAMFVAKRCGVPVRISHAHSALVNKASFSKKLYESIMRRLILRFSTNLVACGEQAGIRLFGEKAYRSRGQLILNGVDVDAFRFQKEKRDSIRKKLGWQDSFLIGHVGHLAEVKNQRYLLDLLPRILERRPEARLIMLGEGKDREMLEHKIRELELSEKVLMPGNVSNVADYMSAMDVFVFPSLYEGMPLSVLEVQANGLPCVISTGVPKDVFLTDLIVPLSLIEDPQLWVDSICTAKRTDSHKYSGQMNAIGMDLRAALQKVYQIYEE